MDSRKKREDFDDLLSFQASFSLLCILFLVWLLQFKCSGIELIIGAFFGD